MTDNYRRVFRPLITYLRWAFQFRVLGESYRANHFYDDKSVGWTWERLLLKTRKVEGVMYRGRDGEVHVELS